MPNKYCSSSIALKLHDIDISFSIAYSVAIGVNNWKSKLEITQRLHNRKNFLCLRGLIERVIYHQFALQHVI